MLPAQLLLLLLCSVSRLFLCIIQACFGNLLMPILPSFNQYLREAIVLPMYTGYLPVSPYTIWFGDLSLRLSSLLHANG